MLRWIESRLHLEERGEEGGGIISGEGPGCLLTSDDADVCIRKH